jgi:hypothetical protein
MSAVDVSERFAAHVGVHIGAGDGPPCGCGATATLESTPGWDDQPGAPAPSAAVLALIDTTARRAAEEAVAGPGRRASLVPTATTVQFRASIPCPVTASASVPCEGVIVDRADENGDFRFSVAVEVVGPSGTRVATGTVQWHAHVEAEVEAASPAHAQAEGA